MSCKHCSARKQDSSYALKDFYCMGCCVAKIKELRPGGRQAQEQFFSFLAIKEDRPKRNEIIARLGK